MLLALTSLCITRKRECLCKYRSPCAIPSIIIRRLFQFSKAFLVSSVHHSIINIIAKNDRLSGIMQNMDLVITGCYSNTKDEEVQAFIWQIFID
jgi:hypothetical protein